MFHSVKSDINGIHKMIMKNDRGEVIHIQHMQPGKRVSSTGELKHQDNDITRTEDLFYQKLEDTHYIILKSEPDEKLRTFVKVSNKQADPEKSIASSSKTSGSSISTATTDLLHQESDTAHELVLPALEDIDCFQILPGSEICFI